MSKRIIFENPAFEDFNQWASLDKKIYQKIVALIKDINRSPFTGLGKPEALKHKLTGYWSRRINDEHRLVYKVTDEAIIIIACKYHYSD
jgi:toxin YoeB